MQKYSQEIEVSIDELESYNLPIRRQRKIDPEAVGLLAKGILRDGLLESITISSSKKKNGKYEIYKGSRRTQAHRALSEKGHVKFKTIRARRLLNDDDPRAVRREVYGTNNDGEKWADEDILEILPKLYPKKRFLENLAGAPKLGAAKGFSLADELAEDWAMSQRTAYRWINRVIEANGWAVEKQKKKSPYPLLGSNEFKFVSRIAKQYIAAEKKMLAAQEKLDEALAEILDPETKVIKKNEFLYFVEDFKKGKARHL
ncbi:ParB N-terminal domain-containing protein (plasmid) [Leptospira interrogans]|uniref:ParB N-terminal domain-containing protein n=1 Tax=Leptospira interrogans TaxID=173 RepID=UPI0002BFA5F6|nr:ParB N-terminal domain-containing protein [Leptospira interrogans]EMN60339.1 ParB-like protein [Leptospira interrogans serovar Pyrogenes str. R168]ULG90720.1 ParB N-terminal domain-containing protein [Leptospira interrogans]UML78436.1 ParB N-terminal domain-containing protein [Leptospira interrogans]